jgi:isoquinoline 1-oxidoreductase alpha subunit
MNPYTLIVVFQVNFAPFSPGKHFYVANGLQRHKMAPLHAILAGESVQWRPVMIRLTVNARNVELDLDAQTPLLWVLRDTLHLRGTKYACGIGLCGSCTVHVDGQAARACMTPLSDLGGKAVTTIEGLSRDDNDPLQQAWRALDVPQCGYCQPGMIMAAAALLREKPSPSDADIDNAMTNICRCGTYNRVRAAIHAAAASGGDKSHD